MINYYIENSKIFNYSTDADSVDVKISVFECDFLIYEITTNLVKNVNYFTSLTYGWNDKKVKILDLSNDEETIFDMPGDISKLSGNEKIKFDKYFKIIDLENKPETHLCFLMSKYGSDKSNKPIGSESAGHNYTKYYDLIFDKIRFHEINLFELGLGTNNINFKDNMGINGYPGASIYAWSDYFINGHIFGADIDTGCLFNTDEIKTFYCDQTNAWIIRQMWDNKYLDFNFDIIIDDGYHMFDANVNFFENSYYKLKKHGIYIIEDTNNNDTMRWIDKFEEYETKFPQFKFEFIQLKYKSNSANNNLIKITYKNE